MPHTNVRILLYTKISFWYEIDLGVFDRIIEHLLSGWRVPMLAKGPVRFVSMDFLLPGGVSVSSPVVVRVAGLPVTTLARLRFEESFAQACEVARLRDQLAAEGDGLSEELYAAIGASRDGTEKPALVGLRRAVFQVRMPAQREWNDQVAAVLSVGLADRLRLWISRLGECERLSARLADTLALETQTKEVVLREIVGHSRFRHALSHASPALFAETAKWLVEETRRPRRQSLIRLAKYVARSAAKTSPFSTFMITGVGLWTEHGVSARFITPTRVEGVLEMNGLLLQRVTSALRENPRLSARLRLRANPSATLHESTIRFLGAPPQESILTVSATPAVLGCLRILEGAASYTMDELRDLLNDGEPDERVERFLTALVDAGLLERQMPVADQATDPLGELADWLAASGGENFSDTVAVVNRVRSQLRGPAPLSDAGGEDVRQQALADGIGDLVERVGLPPDVQARLGKSSVYENAVSIDPVAELSMSCWRPALEDLDVIRRSLAVIDLALPLRVALGAYCAERFGAGSQVPFLLLHEAIAEDLCRDAQDQSLIVRELAGFLQLSPAMSDISRSLGDSRLARLRELDRMRRDLHRVMLSPAAADGVIHVDPNVLTRLSATWPEWVTAPRSVACYLQVVDDEESLRLIVNTLHGGHGRNRSRALHLIRQADATVERDRAWDAEGSEPALAELGGMFGFSLNVRLASVPYEIDYPFTVSSRPAEKRIPIKDLEVVHDPRTDLVRLVAKGLKSEVKALHLGMMADIMLPPAARLLTQAFGTASLWGPSIRRLTSAGASSVPETVLASARVEVGRVIVRRAQWVAPTEQVPVRGKGEPDAGYLLRIAAWLRVHGIPTRCFVRMFAKDLLTPAAESVARFVYNKSRKPVYVDFANWYLVMAFERMLQGPGSMVVFEEALPAPEDTLGPDRTDPSVMEFIVEISEPVTGDD